MDNFFKNNYTKYPQHEFSHLINSKMSFDNTYLTDNKDQKKDLVNALKNINCDGQISLEPRLQEYIKKKKYYKDNNIEPCVPIEKEYQITNEDIHNLKIFLKKNKVVNQSYIKPQKQKIKQKFPSSNFPDDKRVLKAKTKDYKKDIEPEQILTSNYLYAGDELLKSTQINDRRGFNMDNTRFDPRSDPKIYPGIEEYPKEQSQYFIQSHIKKNKKKKNKKKKNTSSIKFDDLGDLENSDDECSFDNNNNINMNNQYQTFGDYNRERSSISKQATRNLDMSEYNKERMYSVDMNIENETCLINGMPTRTSKSYGYRNPVENKFQYIVENFNNAENSVLPFPRGGVSARLQNTKQARPFTDSRQFNTF
tara:strand:+ start:1721 stop:2818 length:1098 start_codon:yes stop_codon:yes gene_type:complete